jgi:hypothetical protein
MSKTVVEVEQPAAAKPLGPPKSVAREYFESFVVTLIMAIFGMTFIPASRYRSYGFDAEHYFNRRLSAR